MRVFSWRVWQHEVKLTIDGVNKCIRGAKAPQQYRNRLHSDTLVSPAECDTQTLRLQTRTRTSSWAFTQSLPPALCSHCSPFLSPKHLLHKTRPAWFWSCARYKCSHDYYCVMTDSSASHDRDLRSWLSPTLVGRSPNLNIVKIRECIHHTKYRYCSMFWRISVMISS